MAKRTKNQNGRKGGPGGSAVISIRTTQNVKRRLKQIAAREFRNTSQVGELAILETLRRGRSTEMAE